MLDLTLRAKQELGRILRSSAEHPHQGLRLAGHPSGDIALMLDNPRRDDEVVEYDGARVLLADRELVAMLAGITIDLERVADSAYLVLSKEPS